MRILYLLILVCVCCAGCSGDPAQLDKNDQRHPSAQKAKLKADSGEYSEAVELYKAALLDDPQLARVHLDLALLLHRIDDGKDLIGAVYHYRQYLELRPESEKRKMIENRIRLASQAYAGAVVGRTGGNQPIIKELEDKNAVLREQVELLEEKNRLLKARILKKTSVASPTQSMDSGRRVYTVQAGDTLESIALFFYRDASRASTILKANHSTVNDPKGLIPGQILTIP